MRVRGDQYREAMRVVVETFGSDSRAFVFMGSCVLGLYSRPSGGPFRQTIDADVVSTVTPWVIQEKRLADLCSREVLVPDEKIACRYHIQGANIAVDVLSPEGKNVGNVTEWLRRAVARAEIFHLSHDTELRAVTPIYFLGLKLEAWRDRGEDARSDKDAEDIVAVATEVPDLAEQVSREGAQDDLRDLWRAALAEQALTIDDLAELVSWHLHPDDAAEEERVLASLIRIARGA